VDAVTVSEAAARTGWSARMLRYLEQHGLVVPRRTAAGYRLYSLRELNQLHALAALRRRFGLDLSEVAFAARLRRDAELRQAVDAWLAAAADAGSWIEWEQRKHERLLAA
jgi:MerR family transcriptional regulator, copper efflux regulator